MEVLLVASVEDQGEGALSHPAHGWQRMLQGVWEALEPPVGPWEALLVCRVALVGNSLLELLVSQA